MSLESDALIERVKNDPNFQELVAKRSRFAWTLSALMVLIYFGFVMTVAFNKEVLGKSLSGGITTVGIPVGIGVILSAFVLTGIYVARANSGFDELTKKIIEKVKR